MTSCSKAPNKVLPKKDGKWKGAWTLSITVGGSTVTNTGNYTVTFDKDGSGTIVDDSSVTTSFTWKYDKEDNKIEFTSTVAGVTTTKDYEVEEMKADEEKWTYSETGLTEEIVLTPFD